MRGLIPLIIIGAIVAGGAIWYISELNKIVRMDEAVSESWAEIDNQLKRRADLIPRLVNCVKGYVKHERAIFTHIADARAKLAGARTVSEKINAARTLDSLLSRLLVIVERYPVLRSSETFQRLMDELSGTENRISVARMRYNRAVKRFNTHIREVIGGFFARIKGLDKPHPYYEVSAAERGTPAVEF